ncbi:hypothetical protein [Aureimonas populi]|uniref:DUF937 domain-containing protein n=1 Tax=Aureimonas populi TaxID=1701758 RepID=A0ABW5CL17_9HYPH|nr:hypothetical protein [Aureimonas populi]
MTDFFDWLAAGDWGLATDRLRGEFRLSQEEMRRTTDALAPAFLLALRRTAADPSAWGALAGGLTAPSPGAGAIGASSQAASATMLAALFGTSALSDAVARHASLFSGVAPDTIRRMMPALAAMTVETVMRMSGWRDATGRQPGEATGERRDRPQEANYLEQLFADALKGGFPWLGDLRGDAMTANMGFLPFGSLNPFVEMTGPFPETSPARNARPAPSADARGKDTPPGGAADAGRAFQEAYMRQMLTLFERHAPKAG